MNERRDGILMIHEVLGILNGLGLRGRLDSLLTGYDSVLTYNMGAA